MTVHGQNTGIARGLSVQTGTEEGGQAPYVQIDQDLAHDLVLQP
jgi:hypothetical protein